MIDAFLLSCFFPSTSTLQRLIRVGRRSRRHPRVQLRQAPLGQPLQRRQRDLPLRPLRQQSEAEDCVPPSLSSPLTPSRSSTTRPMTLLSSTSPTPPRPPAPSGISAQAATLSPISQKYPPPSHFNAADIRSESRHATFGSETWARLWMGRSCGPPFKRLAPLRTSRS